MTQQPIPWKDHLTETERLSLECYDDQIVKHRADAAQYQALKDAIRKRCKARHRAAARAMLDGLKDAHRADAAFRSKLGVDR